MHGHQYKYWILCGGNSATLQRSFNGELTDCPVVSRNSLTVVTVLMVFTEWGAQLEIGFTFTPLPVLGHSVASLTSGTGVGSLCVGTHPTKTQVTLGTLIHIWKQKGTKVTTTWQTNRQKKKKKEENQPITHLHISVHQQTVQTQACSSDKCRNLRCWCKFPRGTHYQFHTRWHLAKRNNLQALFCCHECATSWEVCSGELHPTALDNPLQTFAVFAVWGDLVTMVTGAFMSAVQIDTAAMETDSREHALIHIWRGGYRGRKKWAWENKDNR